MDDLFLKIIKGVIPCAKIYEDELTFAFLDINPNNKGHTLVVPKEKFRNIFDIDETTFVAMAKTVRKVAHAVKEATGADGVNITMNNEKAAHQDIFHVHIHVIPRFKNDGVFMSPKTLTYEEGEIDAVAGKIRSKLS